MAKAIEAQEAFVDAVDFLIRRELPQHTHHAVARLPRMV